MGGAAAVSGAEAMALQIIISAQDEFSPVFNALKESLGRIAGYVQEVADQFSGSLGGALDSVKGQASGLGPAMERGAAGAEAALQGVAAEAGAAAAEVGALSAEMKTVGGLSPTSQGMLSFTGGNAQRLGLSPDYAAQEASKLQAILAEAEAAGPAAMQAMASRFESVKTMIPSYVNSELRNTLAYVKSLGPEAETAAGGVQTLGTAAAEAQRTVTNAAEKMGTDLRAVAGAADIGSEAEAGISTAADRAAAGVATAAASMEGDLAAVSGAADRVAASMASVGTAGAAPATTAGEAGTLAATAGAGAGAASTVPASADKEAASLEKVATSANKADGALQKFSQDSMEMGRGLSLYVTLPLVGIGVAAVAMAARFQRSMELIHSQAGATQAEVNRMTNAVLAMASAVGQGPDALAAALFHLESIGLRGARAQNALKLSAEGASTGLASLEDVANAVGSAMVSQIKGAQTAAETMGTLNAVVGSGNMRMQDLAAAMSTGVMPAAKEFGLSLTDVGAALATLSDAGTPAELAATRLRMTFSLIGAPSKAATKELSTIGLSSLQLANDMRQPNGLLVAMEDLKQHLQDAGLTASEQADVLSRAFGGGRSSAAILMLVNNTDRLQKKIEIIKAGTADFAQSWEATQKTFAFGWSQFLASGEAALIKLGKVLEPAAALVIHDVLMPMVKAVQNLANWLGHLSPRGREIALILAGVVAAAGPALYIFGGMIETFGRLKDLWGAVSNGFAVVTGAVRDFSVAARSAGIAEAFMEAMSPVGWVLLAATAVAAAAVLIITHWKQIKHWTEETFGPTFHAIMKAVRTVVVEVWGYVGPYIKTVFAQVQTFTKQTWPEMQQVITTVWHAIETVIRIATAVIGPLIHVWLLYLYGIWKTVWGLLRDALKGVWDLFSGIVKVNLDIIMGVIKVALDLLTGHWKQAWNDLKTYGGKALNDFWAMVKNVAGDILKTFEDLGTNLLHIVTSVFGAIPAAVSNALSGVEKALPGWAQAILGVKGTSLNLTQPASAIAGAGASTAAGGAQPQVVVNVHGSVMTERDLTDTITKHLATKVKLTGKVAAAH